jgi:hypothetical protein
MKRKETTKNPTKKRFSFSFFKKHKALSVSLIILSAAVASFLVVNYGRYVKNIIEVYYLRTKNFYFNSDKLTINGKTYQINPWSGTVPYSINISMNSMLNSLKGTNNNITYDVSCEGRDGAICYFETMGTTLTHRTITKESHADNFTVTVVKDANVQLKNGDEVEVTITATSTSPYEETLTATFILKIGDYGVNYSIEDNYGSLYLDSLVSNTLPTDTVRVKLEIVQPTLLSFDMSNMILDRDTTQVSYSTINGYQYITAVTFDVNPKSSMMVRFFKADSTQNYSYSGEASITPQVRFTRIS